MEIGLPSLLDYSICTALPDCPAYKESVFEVATSVNSEEGTEPCDMMLPSAKNARFLDGLSHPNASWRDTKYDVHPKTDNHQRTTSICVGGSLSVPESSRFRHCRVPFVGSHETLRAPARTSGS
jgi:hypothetical protein